ncbi:MAG: TetR/AcrR family transcriptional regulator [Anaerolineales bacterium]|nr:TetR/AcrR family transcriptional regulator [Anaerolineales bacterium]
MRKPRDGEDTRQRVLSAAQELFAAKGFAGTSLMDISHRCGISDGLILHHFQSKKNLYRQVLENLAEQYTHNLVQAKESGASPQEMIQQTLSASFNFWKQDTTYQRISLWAYLEGQTELAEKEAYLTAGLFQEVRRLQEQGIMDDRYAPVFLLTLIIGPIHFWLRYRDQFKAILHLPDTADELDHLFLKQLIQLMMEVSHKAS